MKFLKFSLALGLLGVFCSNSVFASVLTDEIRKLNEETINREGKEITDAVNSLPEDVKLLFIEKVFGEEEEEASSYEDFNLGEDYKETEDSEKNL